MFGFYKAMWVFGTKNGSLAELITSEVGVTANSVDEAEELASLIVSLWPSEASPVWVVFTGGEPLLQLDDELIKACSKAGIFMAIETNGTIDPEVVEWVEMLRSPDLNDRLVAAKSLQHLGDEQCN